MINGGEPDSIDPAKIRGQPEGRIAYALFEGLTRYNAAGATEPGVAERWEISPDGLKYTFHLRPALTWADGQFGFSAQPIDSPDEINASMTQNNSAIKASWQESQEELDASIKKNLMANSGKIDKLVHEASNASQGQIQQYVAGLQSDNAKLVKDYFQLTSTDQKKYIEDLLVDFAKYMQQQRSSDLQVVQSRLNSLEKNTSMFKQETEQILSSIITNGSTTTPSKGINN